MKRTLLATSFAPSSVTRAHGTSEIQSAMRAFIEGLEMAALVALLFTLGCIALAWEIVVPAAKE
jgi:hypothetical protein